MSRCAIHGMPEPCGDCRDTDAMAEAIVRATSEEEPMPSGATRLHNVLIYDCETTGLDPLADQVIEAGAILYSVRHATALECYSGLVPGVENPAESVNRIPVGALAEARPNAAIDHVLGMAAEADAILRRWWVRTMFAEDVAKLPFSCAEIAA